MLKWIGSLVDNLKARAKGILANAALWKNQVVTDVEVNAAVNELIAKSDAIDLAQKQLDKVKAEGRALVEKHSHLLKQVESLAEGIHANDHNKFIDYDMPLPKDRKSKEAPGKAVIKSITDDVDGVGFVIVHQALAEAEGFEIERSAGQPADTAVLAPPYTFLKNTQKLSYTDDEVEKGKRYFYRSRAYNRRGYGAWSEPVSRVQ